MKVFISHTFVDDDLKLAETLQQMLEKDGIDGYLAETRKKYDELIRNKIIDEIKNSDHMIAILTENSFDSASVNQELGYALRDGISPVIMLEKNAKQGVLTFGLDAEEFTKDTFSKSCQRVIEHIKNKGQRQKLPENLLEISQKIDRIESKLENSKSDNAVIYSDKNPEVQLYNEIIRYCDMNPLISDGVRKNAKIEYSKILKTRREISEISNAYNSSTYSEKQNFANHLRDEKDELKYHLDKLSDIWTNNS